MINNNMWWINGCDNYKTNDYINTTTCSGVQVSKLTDLTLLMWTPRFLCIPAHLIHKNIPKFQLAHRGPGVKERKNKTKHVIIEPFFTNDSN